MSLNRDCTALYPFPKSAGLKMYMGSFTSNLVESEPRTITKFELSMGGPILKLNLTHNFPCFLKCQATYSFSQKLRSLQNNLEQCSKKQISST